MCIYTSISIYTTRAPKRIHSVRILQSESHFSKYLPSQATSEIYKKCQVTGGSWNIFNPNNTLNYKGNPSKLHEIIYIYPCFLLFAWSPTKKKWVPFKITPGYPSLGCIRKLPPKSRPWARETCPSFDFSMTTLWQKVSEATFKLGYHLRLVSRTKIGSKQRIDWGSWDGRIDFWQLSWKGSFLWGYDMPKKLAYNISYKENNLVVMFSLSDLALRGNDFIDAINGLSMGSMKAEKQSSRPPATNVTRETGDSIWVIPKIMVPPNHPF